MALTVEVGRFLFYRPVDVEGGLVRRGRSALVTSEEVVYKFIVVGRISIRCGRQGRRDFNTRRRGLGGFERHGFFLLRLHFRSLSLLQRFTFSYGRFTQHLSLGGAALQRRPQFAEAIPQADEPRLHTIQRCLDIPIYKKEDRYNQGQGQQRKRPDGADGMLQPTGKAQAYRSAPEIERRIRAGLDPTKETGEEEHARGRETRDNGQNYRRASTE